MAKKLWHCPREERSKVLGELDELNKKIEDYEKTIAQLQGIIESHTYNMTQLKSQVNKIYGKYDISV